VLSGSNMGAFAMDDEPAKRPAHRPSEFSPSVPTTFATNCQKVEASTQSCRSLTSQTAKQ
jgi:hypothetical protein